MNNTPSSAPRDSASAKIWTAIAITALFTVALLLLWKAVNVPMLILAGAILAVYFHGFAGLLQRNCRVPKKMSLPLSVIISIVFLGGLFYLIGARIGKEAEEFAAKLPGLLEGASTYIDQNEDIRSIVDRVKSAQTMEKATPLITGFFNSTFGFLGDMYVVLFIGIFFTASPAEYKKGMVKLLPARARHEGGHSIECIAGNLRSWLKGVLFSMFVVFVLTGLGLFFLGVELWLILALIAGLLSFIPNFGPILAILPAALVGLSYSPAIALWIIVLYCAVQLVESNFITPLVQQELIKTPPALIIIMQVFMGIWLGGWGVILATPVLVIVMVLVDNLYIKKQDEKEKRLSLASSTAGADLR